MDFAQTEPISPLRPAARTARSARENAARQKLAVLHVFKYFRPDYTGEGLYLEKLAAHLADSSVSATVIATATQPRPGAVHSEAVGHPRLFGLGPERAGLSRALLLWFMANARRFDVVHFHSAVDRYFILHLMAQMSGCHVVQSCTLDDGLGSLVAGYRPVYRPVLRRLCRLIDDVVAISPRLHDDCAGILPVERTHLIPQGVVIPDLSADDGQALRARLGIRPDDCVLLFVGGLCPRKDVRLLVDHHPHEDRTLHLIIVGPDLDDAYAAELRAAVVASPSRPKIHVLGYHDDPSAAYRAADIFVFASRQEGFGNVLLEAMSFGLPVICRRLPGVTDLFIREGETGILFDTADGYVAAVRYLAADADARRRIGTAAREAVTAEYDLRAIAQRYVELYGATR
jgi:glycosyltransferase involved in cell wall biosynthesis